MRQGKIICEHCGSAKIARDRELDYAEVQQKDPDTGEPIGDPKTYFIFKCLSCGERIFLEKFEAPANQNGSGGVGERRKPAC